MNLTKTCQPKPKDVTIQKKTLNEHIPMVSFVAVAKNNSFIIIIVDSSVVHLSSTLLHSQNKIENKIKMRWLLFRIFIITSTKRKILSNHISVRSKNMRNNRHLKKMFHLSLPFQMF